jgi:Na+/H+-translocating membrane pyrophosphatase
LAITSETSLEWVRTSLAQLPRALCAALVIGAVAFQDNPPALFFPLAISAIGVLCSWIAVMLTRVRTEADVENALRRSLLIATALLAVGIFIASRTLLPERFTIFGNVYTAWGVLFSALVGLMSGLLVGVTTDYFTSNRYRPVQQLADSAKTGRCNGAHQRVGRRLQ